MHEPSVALKLLGIQLAISIVAIVVAPKLAPFALVLLLVSVLLVRRGHLSGDHFHQTILNLGDLHGLAVLFFGWALTSAIWSPVPLHSAQKAVSTGLVYAVVVWLATHVDRLQLKTRSSFAGNLRNGVLIAAVLLAFEFASGFLISAKVMALFPSLHANPSGTSYVIREGREVLVRPGLFNPSLTVLSLIVWSALLAARAASAQHAGRALGFAYGAAIVVGVLISVYLSAKETAKIAIPLAIAASAVAVRSSRMAHWLAMAGWMAAVLLVVPLAYWLAAPLVDGTSSLPQSGYSRIAIWQRIAGEVAKRPLVGIGADATHHLERVRVQRLADTRADEPHASSPPDAKHNRVDKRWRHLARRHPHNSFLQIWYELGVIGAALLCAWGVLVVLKLRRLEKVPRAFGYAIMTTAVVTASLTNSLWQEWFSAIFAWCFLLYHVARRSDEQTRPSGS